MENPTIIYVRLLDEGTECWRPVDANRTPGDIFEIVSKNPDPDDEHWEFNVGQIVRCEKQRFSVGVSGLHWVAVQEG